eukprot:908520-Amphidinium_carterae.2
MELEREERHIPLVSQLRCAGIMQSLEAISNSLFLTKRLHSLSEVYSNKPANHFCFALSEHLMPVLIILTGIWSDVVKSSSNKRHLPHQYWQR